MTSKEDRIRKLVSESKVSEKARFELLDISREEGFETFQIRKEVWPVLLELDEEELKLSDEQIKMRGGMNHDSPEYQQLKKDADRALFNMETYKSASAFHL